MTERTEFALMRSFFAPDPIPTVTDMKNNARCSKRALLAQKEEFEPYLTLCHNPAVYGCFVLVCRSYKIYTNGVSLSIYSSQIFSISSSHILLEASLGIRQSPLGDNVTVPTFGPSGRQERLNCWEKNLFINTFSHFFIS